MDLLTQLMIFAAVIVALFVIAFIWEVVRRARMSAFGGKADIDQPLPTNLDL